MTPIDWALEYFQNNGKRSEYISWQEQNRFYDRLVDEFRPQLLWGRRLIIAEILEIPQYVADDMIWQSPYTRGDMIEFLLLIKHKRTLSWRLAKQHNKLLYRIIRAIKRSPV